MGDSLAPEDIGARLAELQAKRRKMLVEMTSLCGEFPFGSDVPGRAGEFEISVHGHLRTHRKCPVPVLYEVYTRLGSETDAQAARIADLELERRSRRRLASLRSPGRDDKTPPMPIAIGADGWEEVRPKGHGVKRWRPGLEILGMRFDVFAIEVSEREKVQSVAIGAEELVERLRIFLDSRGPLQTVNIGGQPHVLWIEARKSGWPV